jgi:hypothetical protein
MLSRSFDFEIIRLCTYCVALELVSCCCNAGYHKLDHILRRRRRLKGGGGRRWKKFRPRRKGSAVFYFRTWKASTSKIPL